MYPAPTMENPVNADCVVYWRVVNVPVQINGQFMTIQQKQPLIVPRSQYNLLLQHQPAMYSQMQTTPMPTQNNLLRTPHKPLEIQTVPVNNYESQYMQPNQNTNTQLPSITSSQLPLRSSISTTPERNSGVTSPCNSSSCSTVRSNVTESSGSSIIPNSYQNIQPLGEQPMNVNKISMQEKDVPELPKKIAENSSQKKKKKSQKRTYTSAFLLSVRSKFLEFDIPIYARYKQKFDFRVFKAPEVEVANRFRGLIRGNTMARPLRVVPLTAGVQLISPAQRRGELLKQKSEFERRVTSLLNKVAPDTHQELLPKFVTLYKETIEKSGFDAVLLFVQNVYNFCSRVEKFAPLYLFMLGALIKLKEIDFETLKQSISTLIDARFYDVCGQIEVPFFLMDEFGFSFETCVIIQEFTCDIERTRDSCLKNMRSIARFQQELSVFEKLELQDVGWACCNDLIGLHKEFDKVISYPADINVSTTAKLADITKECIINLVMNLSKKEARSIINEFKVDLEALLDKTTSCRVKFALEDVLQGKIKRPEPLLTKKEVLFKFEKSSRPTRNFSYSTKI